MHNSLCIFADVLYCLLIKLLCTWLKTCVIALSVTEVKSSLSVTGEFRLFNLFVIAYDISLLGKLEILLLGAQFLHRWLSENCPRENCHLWKLPPMKIPTHERSPLWNSPPLKILPWILPLKKLPSRKLTPRKLSPMKVALPPHLTAPQPINKKN